MVFFIKSLLSKLINKVENNYSNVSMIGTLPREIVEIILVNLCIDQLRFKIRLVNKYFRDLSHNVQSSNEYVSKVLYGLSYSPDIYIMGGWGIDLASNSLIPLKSCERISLNDYEIKAEPQMIQARAGLTSTMINDRIFVFGGVNETGLIQSSVERLNISTKSKKTWINVKPMTVARNGCGMVQNDTKLYVAGGESLPRNLESSMEMYDASVDTWVTCKAMNIPRVGCAATFTCNSMFVLGGMKSIGDIYAAINTVEQYDPRVGKWNFFSKSRMLENRFALSVVSDNNCLIYALGGKDDISRSNTAECMDLRVGRWFETQSMISSRAGLTSFMLGESIYSCLGRNDMFSLDSIERYNPFKGRWEIILKTGRARFGLSSVVKMV